MSRRVMRIVSAIVLMLALVAASGCAADSSKSKGSSTSELTGSTKSDASAEQQPEAASTGFPPAPADVSGMRDWFTQAYPAAAWLGRIKSIEYVAGEVPDSGGWSNAIVITTDLDFGTELAMAQEIGTALGEAHPAWAKQYIVRFADGKNMQAGDIIDTTP